MIDEKELELLEEERRRNAELQKLSRIEAEKKKLSRIEAEKKKLSTQFTKMDARTKKSTKSLIENAAFMIITLEDLQAEINYNGVISTYKNGENQFGTKKSPEIEIYNSLIKNHMAIMKQLTDLLPVKVIVPKGDEFDKFVAGRDDVD